jgi:hypothetical protein
MSLQNNIDRITGIRRSIEIQSQKLTHLKTLKSSLFDQAFKGEL